MKNFRGGVDINVCSPKDKIYVANFSGGKDSLAMVLRLLEEDRPIDDVVFYDTGMEFDSIYNNISRVKRVLAEKNIRFTRLCSDTSFLYDMFVRPVKYRDPKNKPYPIHYGYEWCGKRGIRWGTSNKLSSIKKHYKDNYDGCDIFEYVGIAADEPKRIRDDENKIYPLVEWGMTEADCLRYCYDKRYNWDENGVELYSILDRVSCWCCQNKNLKELKNMYIYLPEYWQRLRGIQSRIETPMKGVGKSVFQLEERFKKEIEEEQRNNQK